MKSRKTFLQHGRLVIGLAFLLSLTAAVSCTVGSDVNFNENSPERAFLMGFSPWPYDATQTAVDWIYDAIYDDGDIVSQHIEQGVPWAESYSGDPFPQAFQEEIQSRLDKHEAGTKTLLQINPLNISRDGMALNRGSGEAEPLPAPWDAYALDRDEVKAAYLNYAKRMIDSFDPDYLLLGIEVNLLMTNSPALWDPYVALHCHVFHELKTLYPDLPMGVSLFCCCFFPQWSPEHDLQDQLNGMEDLKDEVDFFAFSVHPFMSTLLAESFPDDYMETLFALTDKPVAISESSYPAQVWQTSANPPLQFNGTQEKQRDFASQMLLEANEADALFVIWFSIRDFDALWAGALNQDEIALIWRDTGLYDEGGNARSAHEVWMSWLGS